jgi:hypothetical protein
MQNKQNEPPKPLSDLKKGSGQMRLFVVCLLMSVASACQTTGDPDCGGLSPIIPKKEDISKLPDHLVDQILINNETGRKNCGWKRNGER